MRKLVLLDEDSILESNSVSYPTLKNMLDWECSENFFPEGEDEKASTRSEKVKSKSLMDISQIKVSNIKLIEEESKLKEIETSRDSSFEKLESERFFGEEVAFVSLFRLESAYLDCNWHQRFRHEKNTSRLCTSNLVFRFLNKTKVGSKSFKTVIPKFTCISIQLSALYSLHLTTERPFLAW